MKLTKDKKILVIVESPNKVSTIKNILKKAGYDNINVSASVGHIMELANGGSYHNTGIEPTKEFELNLKVSEDKHKVVQQLKDQVKNSDLVYIMSDGDREGEVIAWSLIKFLKIPKTKYYRATTHEITPAAVIKALENPVKLSEDLVNAGLARMTLDKMVGFTISPIAKNYIGAKSVGRCQSAGLKLIVDREQEIRDFIPEKYYQLYLNFEKNNTTFKAKYIGTAEKQIDRLETIDQVNIIKKACTDSSFVVQEVKKREKQESPKPPFCTATFQQEVSNKLGLKVKDAMSVAQKLFEGINVGGEHIALITYIRTDDTEISPEFIPTIQSYVRETYGENAYVGSRKTTKQENSQEGHECLRVTDPSMTPEKLASYISNDLQLKVYKIIWQRTIASVMPNAVISETSYIINNNKHLFNLTSNEVLSEGYRKIYNYKDDETEEEILVKETFAVNEKLLNTSLEEVKKITTPPARYTEASLIKMLQKTGIGRPSTFATIVETVLSPTRGYAELESKSIVPTDRGIQLSNFLDRSFSNIINLNYTKDMEKDLDLIANGQLNKLEFLNKFYENLETTIKNNTESTFNGSKIAEKICPKCNAKMVIRRSRFGKLFYGCSNYPKCNGIINME